MTTAALIRLVPWKKVSGMHNPICMSAHLSCGFALPKNFSMKKIRVLVFGATGDGKTSLRKALITMPAFTLAIA